MKLSPIFTSIVVLLTSKSVHSSSELELPGAAFITQKYDNPNQDICTSNINPKCSAYFTEQKFITFGDLPNFPGIGGAPPPSNTSNGCGNCWRLVNVYGGTAFNKSIKFFSIDISTTPGRFDIDMKTMDALTGLPSTSKGAIPSLSIIGYLVDQSECGFINIHSFRGPNL